MSKKIGWLANLNPLEFNGGSEQNDKAVIEAGIKKGYSINIITPQTPYVDFANFELLIISNCNQFDINRLVDITQKIPSVLFHHDFQFHKFQLWFSGTEEDKKCIDRRWEILLKNAKLNIFLSPLHYQNYLKVFDKELLEPHIEVPSCINIDDWKPNPDIKIIPNTCVCVNSLYGFKGKDQVIEYIKNHPDIKFTMVGDNPENTQLPENAELVGRLNNQQLKELYQKSESFLHLPISGPFDRTPIEYKLCNPNGKLILNSRVGCMSYKSIFKDDGKIDIEGIKKLLKDAPNMFWGGIEKYA